MGTQGARAQQDTDADTVGAQQQRSSPGRKPSRLSINMSKATEDALLELMNDKDVSMTEAVRRLVGYGAVVYRAMRDDREVLLRSNGQTERVVLLD